MNDQSPQNPVLFLIMVAGIITLIFGSEFLFPHPETEVLIVQARQDKQVILLDKKIESSLPEVELDEKFDDEVVVSAPEPSKISDAEYLELLLGDSTGSINHDVVVRYYAKPMDSGTVYSLRKYGYYIHERPIDEQYEKFPSNAICYGDSVALEEVQRVAYILIKKGFTLQSISLSKYHDDWKNRAIEIGTDTTVLANQTISLAELRNGSFQ